MCFQPIRPGDAVRNELCYCLSDSRTAVEPFVAGLTMVILIRLAEIHIRRALITEYFSERK